MNSSEAVERFRAAVLDAFKPLLEDGGFVELPRRPGDHVNPFSVRLGNSKVVLEVEGISYGTAAWTKVFRTAQADADRYGLPIRELLASRNPGRRRKPARDEGQLADIRRDAADILQYARDVLAGDFSALDALVEDRKEAERERLARAPSPAQRAANAACAEAGHAFKRGDYRRVVELLTPHLDLLSPSQKKRYQTALERSR